MVNDAEMIREIQKINLKSLKKLDEICRRYGISYWLAYGTLIGAIRHQGFIPWDDDLDVGMLRGDFEKLCRVPAEEWGDDCLLVTGESDDMRQDRMFARVFQNKTRIQSERDLKFLDPKTKKTFYTSCMLDIFIFDFIPDDDRECDRVRKKVVSRRYKALKYVNVDKKKTVFAKVKHSVRVTADKCLRLICPLIWQKYYNRTWKVIANSNMGSRIGTYYSGGDPYVYEYSDVFPLQTAQFEDLTLNAVPNNYDAMLSDMYGDYMAYPPENERYHIPFIYADLGDGREYIIDPIPGSLGEESIKKKGGKV